MMINTCLKYYGTLFKTKLNNEKGQFALDIALGMAVVLVISAFIIMPGLKEISNNFMTAMSNWWNTTMSGQIFKTTGN